MSREFGNSLGSFRNGVFGEFSGESELDSGLNFSGAHGVFLVISNKSGGFLRKSVEGVRNERVHDGHGFLGNASFRVNLLENFVNVDTEGFDSSFVSSDNSFLNNFRSRSGFLGSHFNFIE